MSEREPEPDNVDDQPDHTEDPRQEDVADGGYPETGPDGADDESGVDDE